MSKILLTGFEAFGTTPVNPAERLARHLDGEEIAGAQIVARIIPNSFFICIDVVRAAIEELRPEAVIMMGEYGGRSMLTLERLAQNLNDGARYGLKDNAGKLLQDDLTAPDGPAAYRSSLPIRAMVRAMRDAGVPADISDAAGTFCCNHLMYGILHHIARDGLELRAGWLHLAASAGSGRAGAEPGRPQHVSGNRRAGPKRRHHRPAQPPGGQQGGHLLTFADLAWREV